LHAPGRAHMLPAMRRALIALVVVACGSNPPTAPKIIPPPVAGFGDAPVVTEPVPDPAPPELRLPDTIRPLKHEVQLTLDPSADSFTGTITIDIDVRAETSVVWLHGQELVLKRVALGSGSQLFDARAIYPTKELIGLVLSKPLPPGHAKLTMEYTGKIHKDDGTGIYTAKEGDDWYAYTQFEATDAREAFPCFDEPGFKAPWKVSIKTKKELAAFANTPATSEKDLGDGYKLVEFGETKPLPSYLVAFAVGPFETVDAGKTRGGAPIRIIVPRGRTKDVAYPVEATRPIVDLLEDYFGSPYPYEKIDMIACLVFNAGAMENPGLITWNHNILLTKPQEMTLGRQQVYASVAAHELAHMWFGDYVTLAWWDDIWLNEAFATWAGEKIVDQWKPAWQGAVSAAADKSGVMGSDSLETARAIHNPIETPGDIEQAFDGITYQKGQAVLSMIERHVGADVFKAGVRAYLEKHAWRNATYDDFVASLDQVAAGKDVRKMFDAFVKQSGVPLLSFELSCKQPSPPQVTITQQRYVPTGSQMSGDRKWHIPVCVRWGAGAKTGTDCTILDEATETMIVSSKTCPDWVAPNADYAGYYRSAPKARLLDTLIAKGPKVLTVPEKVGLIGDLTALIGNGTLQQGVALSFVETLSKDKNRYIVDASIGVIGGIEEMVPDNLRPNYERLIKKLYRPRALELGFKSRPGEDDNTKQLRPRLVGLVGSSGNEKQLIDQATALAWKWLDDHKAVEPEMVGVVLGIAAQYGDQKLFDRLRADAKKATDRQERGRLLGAMGAFKDPKIVAQAMAISITDEFELREALSLLQGGFAYPQTRKAAYEFVTKNIDAITGKLPEPFRPYIAFTFVPLCDDTRKKEFEDFFKPKLEKIEGGPKMLAQALEALTLCAAGRKAQTPGVVAFLKRQ
jgi:alanyl aminopeptidase